MAISNLAVVGPIVIFASYLWLHILVADQIHGYTIVKYLDLGAYNTVV